MIVKHFFITTKKTPQTWTAISQHEKQHPQLKQKEKQTKNTHLEITQNNIKNILNSRQKQPETTPLQKSETKTQTKTI